MHWTYDQASDDNKELCQGDIIEISSDISEAFKDVHPYFIDEKYRGFLVVTQTCDLALRGGKCSATHIGLSVIRSLQDIISDSLKGKFYYLAPGIYNKSKQKIVNDLVERLVNQNENGLGLFYLYPDGDAGISVHSVAVLRVTISVKSMHYEKLVKARVGRLSKEFQPKLGWMVGNLYSRVGVSDWKEKEKEQNRKIESSLIQEILAFATREAPLWMTESDYKAVTQEHPEFATMPPAEQDEILKKFQPPSIKDEILDIIAEAAKNIFPKVNESHLENLKTRLKNNEKFESKLKKFCNK